MAYKTLAMNTQLLQQVPIFVCHFYYLLSHDFAKIQTSAQLELFQSTSYSCCNQHVCL